jgi:hypothetical protein
LRNLPYIALVRAFQAGKEVMGRSETLVSALENLRQQGVVVDQ